MNRFVQTRITSNGQALLGLLDKIDTSSGEQLIVMQDKSKLQRLNTLAKSIIDCRTYPLPKVALTHALTATCTCKLSVPISQLAAGFPVVNICENGSKSKS
jgi:hypothetical protein